MSICKRQSRAPREAFSHLPDGRAEAHLFQGRRMQHVGQAADLLQSVDQQGLDLDSDLFGAALDLHRA
jgi:hypothetical protein